MIEDKYTSALGHRFLRQITAQTTTLPTVYGQVVRRLTSMLEMARSTNAELEDPFRMQTNHYTEEWMTISIYCIERSVDDWIQPYKYRVLCCEE